MRVCVCECTHVGEVRTTACGRLHSPIYTRFPVIFCLFAIVLSSPMSMTVNQLHFQIYSSGIFFLTIAFKKQSWSSLSKDYTLHITLRLEKVLP